MPVLKNHRHELFAQQLAQGKSATEAYKLAGYSGDRTVAARLSTKAHILARKAEILEPAAKKVGVTVERMAERLGNVAIARVTDFVKIVKSGKKLRLILTESKDLPPEIADAIASLKPTSDGIEVKFLDPMMAISLLGKHKGMFKENVDLVDKTSLADLVIASYEKGKEAGSKDKPEKPKKA